MNITYPKYLTIFFKEHYGITLSDYIRRSCTEHTGTMVLSGIPIKEAMIRGDNYGPDTG